MHHVLKRQSGNLYAVELYVILKNKANYGVN